MVLHEITPFWEAAQEVLDLPEGFAHLLKLAKSKGLRIETEPLLKLNKAKSLPGPDPVTTEDFQRKYPELRTHTDLTAADPTRQLELDEKARELECGPMCEISHPVMTKQDGALLLDYALAEMTSKLSRPELANCAMVNLFDMLGDDATKRSLDERENMMKRASSARRLLKQWDDQLTALSARVVGPRTQVHTTRWTRKSANCASLLKVWTPGGAEAVMEPSKATWLLPALFVPVWCTSEIAHTFPLMRRRVPKK